MKNKFVVVWLVCAFFIYSQDTLYIENKIFQDTTWLAGSQHPDAIMSMIEIPATETRTVVIRNSVFKNIINHNSPRIYVILFRGTNLVVENSCFENILSTVSSPSWTSVPIYVRGGGTVLIKNCVFKDASGYGAILVKQGVLTDNNSLTVENILVDNTQEYIDTCFAIAGGRGRVYGIHLLKDGKTDQVNVLNSNFLNIAFCHIYSKQYQYPESYFIYRNTFEGGFYSLFLQYAVNDIIYCGNDLLNVSYRLWINDDYNSLALCSNTPVRDRFFEY